MTEQNLSVELEALARSALQDWTTQRGSQSERLGDDHNVGLERYVPSLVEMLRQNPRRDEIVRNGEAEIWFRGAIRLLLG